MKSVSIILSVVLGFVSFGAIAEQTTYSVEMLEKVEDYIAEELSSSSDVVKLIPSKEIVSQKTGLPRHASWECEKVKGGKYCANTKGKPVRCAPPMTLEAFRLDIWDDGRYTRHTIVENDSRHRIWHYSLSGYWQYDSGHRVPNSEKSMGFGTIRYQRKDETVIKQGSPFYREKFDLITRSDTSLTVTLSCHK